MSDADCTPGREPRSIAASLFLLCLLCYVSLLIVALLNVKYLMALFVDRCVFSCKHSNILKFC